MLRYEMMANPCPVAICCAAIIAACQLQSEMKVTLGPPCLGQALLCIQQVNIFSLTININQSYQKLFCVLLDILQLNIILLTQL